MSKSVDLIGVPFDLGGGRSGARGGPEAFRRSGMIPALERAHISVRYQNIQEQSECPGVFDSLRKPRGRVYYEKEVAAVTRLVGARTFASLRLGHLPVVLGGDHSLSIGSIGAMLHPDILRGRTLGLVWIDAHYDAHTHLTTHSHRAHGLPLATLLGYGPRSLMPRGRKIRVETASGRSIRQAPRSLLSPGNVLHIGAGTDNCESEEDEFFETHGIPRFSRAYLQKEGWGSLWDALCALLCVDLLWVSLDLDAIDGSFAPGVYYRNPDGLLREELLLLASRIADSGKLCGVDIMEYNPKAEEFDVQGNSLTAGLATEFLLQILRT